jgi:hypothetical protein
MNSILCKSGGHIALELDLDGAPGNFIFKIDRHLHILEADGSLESKLMLCELHALTSYFVPDPFTQLRGIERALTILRSAEFRSYQPLTQEIITSLVCIANLTPGREFYPKHLQSM